jgi:hypothetical protein
MVSDRLNFFLDFLLAFVALPPLLMALSLSLFFISISAALFKVLQNVV